MFDPTDKARVFAVPPGVDFPAALVLGLNDRLAHRPPLEMARVQLVVNTARMARRVKALFDTGPARLLPRIQLLTDLGRGVGAADLPAPVPALRRRFELIQLISRLLHQQPDLASRASIYDLADSLAGLMDEMQGEGVSFDAIEALDVTDQSGHWARAKAFLGIVRHFLNDVDTAPDAQSRQRMVVERMIEDWRVAPPAHPVILAGSTGSRGTTMLLMQAIAQLPQGAIILPGFDFDTPDAVWDALSDPLQSEDHPQFRFRKLMDRLEIAAADIDCWNANQPPCPARNKLVSLALRPAPVTDQWLTEGPALRDLGHATHNVTLIEAASMREEALAIAARLRQAAEDGQTAALITPDRMLTRQVATALDRWDIEPDDSAGTPLQLSPPGRFLRHIAALFQHKLTSEALLTLLKHPLTHSGQDRGPHLRLTRELELWMRRRGVTYPDPQSLLAWGTAMGDDAPDWVNWLIGAFCCFEDTGEIDLAIRLETHLALAERIAQGPGDGSGELWQKKAGQEARKITQDMRDHADIAGPISAADYDDLFGAILSRAEVRDRDSGHPCILIWGTLEARVQGADLVILGGLNEGSWPEAPSPDPWLNRKMRHDAGLLLPERRIGLSAHDFQQAVLAPEVWITRAIRSDEAETVPSRWINRLTNLLGGLPDQGGQDALQDMRTRGAYWLDLVRAMEDFPSVDPVKRPSPIPPPASRPNHLSVTEIKRLIRDPYAIYAKHVLRLRPLDPLMRTPDALLRGIIVHDVLEEFVKNAGGTDAITRERLLQISETVLAKNVPWPTARALWKARMERVSDHFVSSEHARMQRAQPVAFEDKATGRIDGLDFTLTAKADRIDRAEDGRLILYDYKTGSPPSKDEQIHFDKQLLLEAAMAERGEFASLDAETVADAIYIGLGSSPKDVPAPLGETAPQKVWEEFVALITHYKVDGKGFTARRAMHSESEAGDYDQLARFGEWDATDAPDPEELC
ncbi:double-strand break repair protein AddB [Shimia aestuarii]|uniref:Double-strand break repair protein AddB n=1 Tax=Shimia aestuarii TaxID=254406 RepID=A0A1I4KGB2_9RHOB|nr:double-strand break repair protein AddB [Shimia aestuarii]SFL77790.1 double-strand break repair protein AddB [Shimia aestuarii]